MLKLGENLAEASGSHGHLPPQRCLTPRHWPAGLSLSHLTHLSVYASEAFLPSKLTVSPPPSDSGTLRTELGYFGLY